MLTAFLVCLSLSYDHRLSYRTCVGYGDELCENNEQQQQSLDRYFAFFEVTAVVLLPFFTTSTYILQGTTRTAVLCIIYVCDGCIVYTAVCCQGITYLHY